MSTSSTNTSFWRRHLDQIGVGGSIFAALCCLGFPALLAIMSAIGLGFLINDAILIPLLIAFLAVTLWGLYLGTRHHRQWVAFAVGAGGSLLLLASVWLGSGIAAGLGIAGLVIASILNVWLRVRQLKAGSTIA